MDNFTASMNDAAKARFWAKVTKTKTCWMWQGSKDASGYGMFGLRINGKTTTKRAHRIAYQLAGHAIPDGLILDHVCHTPSCVNPGHVRLATRKQNAENRTGAQQNNTVSGIRGVYYVSDRSAWRAQVRNNQELIHVGYFATKDEADAAASAKRAELFTHSDMDLPGKWAEYRIH